MIFKNQYSFLSNFTPCTIEFFGHKFSSLEHAYQSAKCVNEYDVIRIRDCITPGIAKKMGAKVEVRKDWEEVKISVMRSLLKLKFSQSPFKEKLLATGDVEIVEDNWWSDYFWGKCNGIGKNNLGILLMEIRSELRQ